MKKLILLLLLLGGLLLSGCGSNNTDTAIEYLDALNQRDVETARSLVCSQYEDDVTMGLTSVDDPEAEAFAFSEISCAARGSDVSCRFAISQLTEGADTTGVEQTRQVVFDFENGRVCGFEEEVAGQ